MDQYNLYTSDHKKALLVPVIVLLLFMTAFTGMAYAYSNVIVNENTLAGEYYQLDYTNDVGTPIDTVIGLNANKDFTAYTVTTIDEDGRDFKAYIEQGSFTRSFYVTMHTDMGDSQQFTLVTQCPSESVLSQFITDVSIVCYDKTSGEAVTNIINGQIVRIVMTFEIGETVCMNDITGITPNGSDIEDTATLESALDDICTHTYSITVSATPSA